MQTILATNTKNHFGHGDLELLVIENEYAIAVISLQGAQLLSYQRKRDQREFLWLSDTAVFEPGKAIRGGVPVCLPWFGPKEGKAQHGFARNQLWRQCDDLAKFEFVGRQSDPRHDFDHDFTATIEMIFTEQLEFKLSVSNQSAEPMPLSWALHSYHPVDDIAQVRISGLDQCHYVDNANHRQRGIQSGELVFDGETDRAYLQAGKVQRIEGQFEVAATNSQSAVIWNPGLELASRMADLSDHRRFVCLERGDVLDDQRLLAPSETFVANVRISAL